MIFSIRKELLAHLRTMRYPLTFILVIVAALGVTVIRTQIYKFQVKDHAQSILDMHRTMDAAIWTWQSNALGLTFEKAPNPLAIFSFGLENEMTRSIKFCETYPDKLGLRKLNATAVRYFSQIDICTVIFLGCSLLALMLVFDSVCGEREAGTLRIVLSGPIARSTVILSKAIAGLVALAVPICIAWGVSVAYSTVAGGVHLAGGELLRVGGMCGLSVLYVACFFALGLAVSCWTRASSTALVYCLCAWMVMILGLPAASRVVADARWPMRPEAALQEEMDQIRNTLHQDAEMCARIDQRVKDIMQGDSTITQRDAWLSASQIVYSAIDEKCSEAADRDEKRMYNNVLTYRRMIRLSPALAFISATTELAGTGGGSYLHFLSDVRHYGKVFQQATIDQKNNPRPRLAMELTAKMNLNEDPFAMRFDWALWPEFKPSARPLIQQLPSLLADCASIVGAIVVFLLAAIVGFMRLEL